MTNVLQNKIAEKIKAEKEKQVYAKELKKTAENLIAELGIDEIEAENMAKEIMEDLEKEKKVTKGEKILKDLGFKLPEKIYMSYWERINKVNKDASIGKIGEAHAVGEVFTILNKGEVLNQKLKDTILNLDLGDFEAVSLYMAKVIENETSKKK